MASNTPNENEQDRNELSRVALKAPPFWKPDPNLWFYQLEAQFRNNRITLDQTKFDAVVGSVDAEILSQVIDIIRNPPATEKYETLKKRIVSVFADSENLQIRKLLNELELGDLKPSQLLLKMKNLSGDKINDDFLKNLWLQRLPREMQAILSASSDNIENLAAMADRMWELNPSISINNVSQNDSLAMIQKLESQINALSLKIDSISNRNYRSRHVSPARKRSKSPFPRVQGLCFYHTRFGENAQKCKPPCSKANNSGTSN